MTNSQPNNSTLWQTLQMYEEMWKMGALTPLEALVGAARAGINATDEIVHQAYLKTSQAEPSKEVEVI